MDFSNAQRLHESLPKVDDVNLKPISRQYLKIVAINKLSLWFILMAALILAKLIIQNQNFQALFWYICGLALMFCSLNVLIAILAFKKRKYAIRDHDIIYSHGLVINSMVTVPISRIQHIEESRSWLARQFGLSALNIFTAGESGSDLSIKGLSHTEAKQIKDFISEKINAFD